MRCGPHPARPCLQAILTLDYHPEILMLSNQVDALVCITFSLSDFKAKFGRQVVSRMDAVHVALQHDPPAHSGGAM